MVNILDFRASSSSGVEMEKASIRKAANPSMAITSCRPVGVALPRKTNLMSKSGNVTPAITADLPDVSEADRFMQVSDYHQGGAFVGMIFTSILFALLASMLFLVAGGGYVSALGIYCLASFVTFTALCVLKMFGKQANGMHL